MIGPIQLEAVFDVLPTIQNVFTLKSLQSCVLTLKLFESTLNFPMFTYVHTAGSHLDVNHDVIGHLVGVVVSNQVFRSTITCYPVSSTKLVVSV